NGRRIEVRVNDRGPFVGGRIIDLSQEAARQLGFERQGTARVRVKYLGRAPLPEAGWQVASTARTPAPAYAPPPASPAPTPTVDRSPSDLDWAAPHTVSSRGSVASTGLTALASPAYAAAPPMAATPVSTVPTPLGAEPGAFRIQAGAFTRWENARKRADAVDATGLARAKIETVYQGGENLYRVLVDGPASEGEAWAMRDDLMRRGIGEARVVRR
ncbi:MAG: RlpA-like double-psi beta-barrel domain-containing protein, partial [Phenylobacterium sp.]